jgi:hypothetical protein
MILKRIDEIIYKGYKEKTLKDTFELEESNPSAKCKRIKIQRTKEVLAYKFDKTPLREGEKIKDKFPFLNDVSGVKSMADFILFYVNNDKLFIIICNLKSGNTGNSADQIESSEIFANFLFETAKRKYKEDFIGIKPQFKRVLFSSIPLFKGGTSLRKKSQNKTRNYVSNELQNDTCDLDVICN